MYWWHDAIQQGQEFSDRTTVTQQNRLSPAADKTERFNMNAFAISVGISIPT